MSKQEMTKFSSGGAMASYKPEESAMEIAIQQQMKAVEAQALLAKRFPRDESECYDAIMRACERKRLALEAAYQYSRGGNEIVGPSIHLARVCASIWGNIDYGFMELARDSKRGESHVMSYAWDLQTNARETRVFVVRHQRETKAGSKPVRGDRDIYEHVANHAARRTRECIFDIIPRDIREDAMERCNRTLTEGHEAPLSQRIPKMIEAFKQFGVTVDMLANRFQKPPRSFNERDLAQLARIYTSLRDGIGSVQDFFSSDVATKQEAKPASKTEAMEQKFEQQEAPEPPEVPEQPEPKDEATEAPKRKRGRPRKNPPPDPSAPKRKRGRPRKNSLPEPPPQPVDLPETRVEQQDEDVEAPDPVEPPDDTLEPVETAVPDETVDEPAEESEIEPDDDQDQQEIEENDSESNLEGWDDEEDDPEDGDLFKY